MNAVYQLPLRLWDDAALHVAALHGTAEGLISFAQKTKNTWRQRHYQVDELLRIIPDLLGADTFISQNTFFKPERMTRNVRQLRSLFVDVDCHKFGLNPEQALGWLEDEFFDKEIPIPNMIVFSGRGLALIWKIKPAPKDALPLWQYTQDWLCRKLEVVGADPKACDAARVLRVAGSVNSRNGKTVLLMESHSREYTLKWWQREWLPCSNRKKTQVLPAKVGRLKHVLNAYTLAYARMNDLEKLVQLRDGDCKGYREMILFLYRYYACMYEKDCKLALKSVLELNKRFRVPLSIREAVRNTRSAEKAWATQKLYRYRNTTLIEQLGITPEEQQQLGTIISTQEKYRRNNDRRKAVRSSQGVATREEYLEAAAIKAREAKSMRAQGMSVRAIASALNISKTSVSRYLK